MGDVAQQSNAPAAGSGTRLARGFRGAEGRRRLMLLSALALFGTATAGASTQGFRDDPTRPPRMIFSMGWWQQRLEQNAVRRLPEIQGNILGISLVPGTGALWICGTDGLLLKSTDGGRTWEDGFLPPEAFQPAKPPASAKYLDPQAADPPKGTGSGQSPPIPNPGDKKDLSLPEGATSPSRRPAFHAIQFVSATTGWLAGDYGTLLRTRDGGVNWTRVDPGTPQHLWSLHFLDSQRGWVGGAGGDLAATVDGGATWKALPNAKGQLKCLRFLDSERGWSVVNRRASYTQDGGKSWTSVAGVCDLWSIQGAGTDSLYGGASAGNERYLFKFDHGQVFPNNPWVLVAGYGGESIYAAAFPDPKNFWLAGVEGRILHSSNGGSVWEIQHAGTSTQLNALAFADSRRGWAVGQSGTVLATSDGGKAWHPLTQSKGTAVSFGAGDSWQIADGRILRSRNGESTPVASRTFAAPPASVHFINAEEGWVWLQNGDVAETGDGGRSWSILGPHRPWFAPWYLFTFIPVLFLLYRGWQKPPPVAVLEESVADLAVSDRPIGPSDPDPLHFGELARGISRFLRNENTEPPVTVAITGAWGTGKSSLMNLLKADLRLFGFRPVWFNAWHHQNEENLLAALLQAIRMEATPHILSPLGIPFRVKLLGQRIVREWFRFLIISAVFALSLGYVITYPEQIRDVAVTAFSASQDGSLWKDPLDFLFKALGPSLGVFGGAGFLLRALRGFGLNPAELLASKTGNTKRSALEAQTAFRILFGREFNAVASALRPKTLTIFIDDLDRCSPENVLKILEAVNFLVSSGPCTVVMGLDLNYVRSAVENVLEKQMTRQFADRYLEKLVNLEVPVPTPTNDQMDKFIGSTLDRKTAADEPSGAPRWLEATQSAIVVAISLAILVGTVFLGSRLPPPPEPQAPPGAVEPSYVHYRDLAPGGAGERVVTAAPGRSPENASSKYVPSPPSTIGIGLLYLLLVPLAAAAAGGFFLQGDVEVRDSPRFKEALKVWNPLLIRDPANPEIRATPRAMKRFLNRLRYLAMMQRRSPPLPQPVIRFLRWCMREKPRAPEDYLAQNAMAEETLVALSMVRYCRKEWHEGLPAYADFLKHVKPLTSEAEYARLIAGVNEALWKDMEANLRRFAGIGAAVRLA